MTQPEHDEVFEAFLKRRPVLPNGLDDRLEPPAALDEIVLQRAHDAIKTQAAPGAKQQMVRAPRWAMPVALAATILLCLSVVLNISLNTSQPTPNLQRLTADRANVNSGTESDARDDGRTNNDGERRQSVSGDVPSREVILTEAKVSRSSAPRAPVVADSATASPPPAPASAPTPASTAAPTPSAFASTSAPASTAAPTAPSAFASAATPASTAAPAPSAFASTAPPASTVPPAAPSAFASATPPVSTAAPAAPASTVASAPSAQATTAGAVAASGVARARASAYAESAQPPSPEEPRFAAKSATDKAASFAKRADASPPGSAPSATGSANAPTLNATAPHPTDPKVWLQQIDALRAAGETDQADAEMRRFRAVFPAYAAKPAPPASSEPPK
jgi:hypothetical protein